MPVTVEMAPASGAAGERSSLEALTGLGLTAASAKGPPMTNSVSMSETSGRKRLMGVKITALPQI
jgi:hypothetical protein